jgi:hypothetical protein
MAVHSYRVALTCPDDRPALFIKLSSNCGSALEQTSSDSRSTGVLRFGVSSCVLCFFKSFYGRAVGPAVMGGVSL